MLKVNVKLVRKPKAKRLDTQALSKDSRYDGWKMNHKNLAIIQDSLENRGMNFAQRRAILATLIPENGGNTGAHGNGAVGIAGWRGARAVDVPKDLPGLIHKMMVEIYSPSNGDTWYHGGPGSGINSGEDMRQLFLNSLNSTLATKAFMKGYVRPETSQHKPRLNLMNLLGSYMK